MNKAAGFISGLILVVLIGVGESSYASSLVLERYQTRGDGCPPGTASVSSSFDSREFSIFYDQMFVSKKGSHRLRPRAERKSCEVIITYTHPQQTQLAVEFIDYRAFMHLPHKGSFGRIDATIRFLGGFFKDSRGRLVPSEQGRESVRMDLRGPNDEDTAVFWRAEFNRGSSPTLEQPLSSCAVNGRSGPTWETVLIIENRIQATVIGPWETRVFLDTGDGRIEGLPLGSRPTSIGVGVQPCR